MPGRLGVYVHFPWCRKLCPYCDFPVTVVKGDPPHRDYAAAILAELDERAELFAGRELVSIYFGGGTPSLWEPACLAEVISTIATRFAGRPREVTLEANPIDCAPARLAAWRAAGITRLSIGVQSTVADELAVLGRSDLGDGLAAVTAALAGGFASISADVILGPPTADHQPPATDQRPPWLRLADLGVPHLSVYELTIEEKTRFGRRHRAGTLPVLGDEQIAGLLSRSHDDLTGAGYEHYEVSSYARPGARSVHNSLYWSGAEYLGLGVGAASFWRGDDAGRRWKNQRSTRRYLAASGRDRVADEQVLTPHELELDELWLAMRTRDGVAASRVPSTAVDRLLADGLVELEGGRLRPTPRGFLFSNQIALRLTVT